MRTYSAKVQAKREAKRQEIAKAAARLFQEKGYDGVCLLDIAREVNLSRTTVYEYFFSKHEILAFHLVTEMRIYHRRVADIFFEGRSFNETMEEFIKVQIVYGAIHANFGNLFRALERNAIRLARRTKTQIQGLHGEVYRLMTKAIQEAIRRGEIRDLNVGLLMQLVVNATSLPIRGTENTDQSAKAILDVIWRGIGKK